MLRGYGKKDPKKAENKGKRMKKSESPLSPKLFCAAFVVFCLCAGVCLSDHTKAQHRLVTDGRDKVSHKISQEISERLQMREDLQTLRSSAVDDEKPLSVIVQFDDNKVSSRSGLSISALLNGKSMATGDGSLCMNSWPV